MSSTDWFPDWYNSLPTIEKASDILTKDAQAKWLPEIAKVMVEDDFKSYALTLVHHHVRLRDLERMIITGPITRPENVGQTQNLNVIRSSWNAEGMEFEWQRVVAPSDLVPPPSDDLFQKFRNIFKDDSSGVMKVLGLTLRPEVLESEEVWWESTDVKLRQHMVERRKRSSIPEEGTFKTCWIPQRDPMTMEVVMLCCSLCRWHKRLN
ncbi:hypothetical protein EST38_g11644 [Candolleomyces aberdarensis]|uniref:Uncharacterized protein n=1 Tax=Candolleomyces aberdarensis TaxID=2316362 RepID=A0A4Q2D5V4_9AGAR|nr:hypothetical protein EST38_g11644 [Candolleomyces aberdarensis]